MFQGFLWLVTDIIPRVFSRYNFSCLVYGCCGTETLVCVCVGRVSWLASSFETKSCECRQIDFGFERGRGKKASVCLISFNKVRGNIVTIYLFETSVADSLLMIIKVCHVLSLSS